MPSVKSHNCNYCIKCYKYTSPFKKTLCCDQIYCLKCADSDDCIYSAILCDICEKWLWFQ